MLKKCTTCKETIYNGGTCVRCRSNICHCCIDDLPKKVKKHDEILFCQSCTTDPEYIIVDDKEVLKFLLNKLNTTIEDLREEIIQIKIKSHRETYSLNCKMPTPEFVDKNGDIHPYGTCSDVLFDDFSHLEDWCDNCLMERNCIIEDCPFHHLYDFTTECDICSLFLYENIPTVDEVHNIMNDEEPFLKQSYELARKENSQYFREMERKLNDILRDDS